MHFPYPVNATSVTILNNNVATSRFLAGQLTFSNGYSTPIALDSKGQGTVTFPEQAGITWVRLNETSPVDNPDGAALAEFIVAGSSTPPVFRLNEGVGRQGNNLAASLPGVAGCDPNANRPPAITSAPPVQAQVGAVYTYTVQAFDPDNDPVTFALLAAPPGMAIIAGTGVISWTPTVDQAAVFTVTVQAADNRGGTGQQTYALAVDPGNRPPSFTSTPLTTAMVGQTYIYSATATDPDGDLVLFALQQAPANTVFDALSGALSWTPSIAQPGARSFTVEAQDESGARTLQSFSVIVAAAPAPPLPPDLVIAKTDQQTTVQAHDTVTYTLTISNVGGQAASGVTVSDTLPAHTAFSTASDGGTEASGRVTWPAFNLAAGASVTRTVTVRVNNPLPAGVDTLTNLAMVKDDGSHGADPTPNNNSASDTDIVRPRLTWFSVPVTVRPLFSPAKR